MVVTAELAGFFSAHAVWCVSDGQPLTPLVAYSIDGAKPGMQRFVNESYEEAVDRAREFLEENPRKANRGVLIFDGYITLGDDLKTDALLVEAQDYDEEKGVSLIMAIPYRNAESKKGFAVHRPKIIEYEGPEEHPNFAGIGESFLKGVDAHEEGGRVWSQFMDESI